MDTKRKGNSTELSCISKLYDYGCEILLPYGDSQLYDIVIEYNHNFYKIQCKHANPHFDEYNELASIDFKTSHESGRKAKKKNSLYKKRYRFFATFINNECYLIPVEKTPHRYKTLRFKKPKNGMITNINFAADYTANEILSKL